MIVSTVRSRCAHDDLQAVMLNMHVFIKSGRLEETGVDSCLSLIRS
jgi:hypothetical protein